MIENPCRRSGLFSRWYLVLFAVMAALLTSAAATEEAGAVYVLSGLEDDAIVLDPSGSMPDLNSKTIFVSTDGTDLAMDSGLDVTIRRGGQSWTLTSRRETITRMLKRVDIIPSPIETIAVDLSGPGVTVTVGEEVTCYEYVDEKVEFETVRVPNPEMKKGEEKVTQEGADGVRSSVYEVVYSNGKELSRQFVEELDSTAVDKIIEYGTAEEKPVSRAAEDVVYTSGIAHNAKNGDGSGTLTLDDGSQLRYTSSKTMTATAYSAGEDGVDYTTASGTFVHVGVVAVDRNVVPLGTRMYIVTKDGFVYGPAVAEDTGVRGNKVDLYFDTVQECIQFGRRRCTVYFLE